MNALNYLISDYTVTHISIWFVSLYNTGCFLPCSKDRRPNFKTLCQRLRTIYERLCKKPNTRR